MHATLLYLRVNIYEKKFYQSYEFIIVYYSLLLCQYSGKFKLKCTICRFNVSSSKHSSFKIK